MFLKDKKFKLKFLSFIVFLFVCFSFLVGMNENLSWKDCEPFFIEKYEDEDGKDQSDPLVFDEDAIIDNRDFQEVFPKFLKKMENLFDETQIKMLCFEMGQVSLEYQDNEKREVVNFHRIFEVFPLGEIKEIYDVFLHEAKNAHKYLPNFAEDKLENAKRVIAKICTDRFMGEKSKELFIKILKQILYVLNLWILPKLIFQLIVL